MVKVMYNDQLVYKVVIWTFLGIGLWTKKVALKCMGNLEPVHFTSFKRYNTSVRNDIF